MARVAIPAPLEPATTTTTVPLKATTSPLKATVVPLTEAITARLRRAMVVGTAGLLLRPAVAVTDIPISRGSLNSSHRTANRAAVEEVSPV